MPAYNFKKQFAQDIITGRKKSTIRPKRKRPTKPGDRLFLFTGQRTKSCTILRPDVPLCKAVNDIQIRSRSMHLDGKKLTPSGERIIAHVDGFESPDAMRDFFRARYGLPTRNMEMILWD